MDNQPPPINRDMLIPILIGGFSLIGIIAVLLIARSLSSPAEVVPTPSETAVAYIFLGTEPAITTPLVEGSELAPTDDILAPGDAPALSTPTRSAASTPIILTQLNVTNTPAGLVSRTNTPNRPTATAVSGTFTYDDTDQRLIYTGAWMGDPNISEAYQGTLHISTGLGDSVTFAFTGQRIHMFYQAGPSLGTISITIDGNQPILLNQTQAQTEIKEWISDTLPSGTHSILVQHFSGGSVNIDSFVVPAATTATPTVPVLGPAIPTATPTATPTVNLGS